MRDRCTNQQLQYSVLIAIAKLWAKYLEILSRKPKNLEYNKDVSLEKKEGKYEVSNKCWRFIHTFRKLLLNSHQRQDINLGPKHH